MGILSILSRLIFPQKCPGCGRYTDTPVIWCDDCLTRTLRPRRIGLSMEQRKYISGAVSLCAYHGTIRDLIRASKYHSNQRALRELGILCAESISSEIVGNMLSRTDVITPVPLFAKKERKRGFNQSEAFFRPLSKAAGIPIERLLLRTRETPPQYGLSARQRRVNLRGAFAVSGHVKGRHVLLVDDIFTTGSTALSCAEPLIDAGAAAASILVLSSDA